MTETSLKNGAKIFIIWILLTSFLYASTTLKILIPFEMKDQFKNLYRDTDFRGAPFIILGGDKAGSAYTEQWAKAIRESLKTHPGLENIKIFRIADVRGVPFFAKGIVRNKFPKEKDKWVAIDWGGKFSKQYNFIQKACNILVFDKGGNLIHQSSAREIDVQLAKTISSVMESHKE
jgi:hypothetical protein